MSDVIYNPPGVYVNEDALPVPNLAQVVALPASRLAIVGPALGYEENTEAIILTGTTAVTLSELGIDSSSIVVTSLTGTVIPITEEDTTVNYAITQSGSPSSEQTTSIARGASSTAIVSGQTVYVSYRYTNSSYLLPFTSTDFDEIQSRFGSAFNTSTGAINSPLTLAAKIAMEQGLRELVLVPTDTTSTASIDASDLVDAYGYLEARSDIGVVVPLPVGITGTDVEGEEGETGDIGPNLQTHVESASDSGNYRIGIFGLARGASRSHETLAAAISSSRVVLTFPNAMTYYNGYLNSTMEIDGFYLAAAIGAMVVVRNPQDPVTRKPVRSFSSIPGRIASTMTPTFKNNLSANGVAVAEQTFDNRIIVRHGVATDVTHTLTREISITRAKDTMMKMIYRALENSGLIGAAIVAETPIRVRSIVEGVLEQASSTDMIVGYSNLKVRTSTVDSTAIEVKFAYRPAYPLNYVNVSFSVNTLTGSTTEV